MSPQAINFFLTNYQSCVCYFFTVLSSHVLHDYILGRKVRGIKHMTCFTFKTKSTGIVLIGKALQGIPKRAKRSLGAKCLQPFVG